MRAAKKWKKNSPYEISHCFPPGSALILEGMAFPFNGLSKTMKKGSVFMSSWNPEQYLKFSKERTQPAIDLAARVPLDEPAKILDIGCGPGNSTAVLRRRFPNSYILGIDSSPEMIEKAKKELPSLDFQLCDVTCELNLLSSDFDLAFSNACLQWVPDHPVLLPKLLGLLTSGGILAVQIPMNQKEPIHRILEDLASQDEWKEKGLSPRLFHTLSQGEYFDILSKEKAFWAMWQTSYIHVMDSHQDILEWYKGTGLRPYLSQLSPEDQAVFLQEVEKRVQQSYPIQANGQVLFPFPRFFFMARKG